MQKYAEYVLTSEYAKIQYNILIFNQLSKDLWTLINCMYIMLKIAICI
jgi:hypothetical protein